MPGVRRRTVLREPIDTARFGRLHRERLLGIQQHQVGVGQGVPVGLVGQLLDRGVAAAAEHAMSNANDPDSIHDDLTSCLHVLAAVDLDHLAGNVPGFVRSQEAYHLCDFLRLAQASQWNSRFRPFS